MKQAFHLSAIERLEFFLSDRAESNKIELLTPDASTRDYFRIKWKDTTAIACIYPEPFNPLEHSYLDATALFLACGLPVAKIYELDSQLGIIVLEDFGDNVLRDVLIKAGSQEKERLIHEAITLIAEIQAATPKAFELKSIASRLKFDEEKLLWELNFFKTHYFETFRKEKQQRKTSSFLDEEFLELSLDLAFRAKVLCHRDFHTANIMIDKENRLRIIDHQDARIGATSYDLVSLVLDRIVEPPAPEWLNDKKRFFLAERERIGLEKIDFEDFNYEFDLMTVQRCLKAIGTFSFQSVNRGKIHFIQYIEPMSRIVLETCKRLQRFPNLQKLIEERI